MQINTMDYLPFEQPIADLELSIHELEGQLDDSAPCVRVRKITSVVYYTLIFSEIK